MGKQSSRSKGQDAGSNADLKRCRRALRSLDLVDSRLDVNNWNAQVSRYVGEDTVDEWMAMTGTDLEQIYDWSYGSFERAMHFSVGWRSSPLTAECEWMLPRLRDAITRTGEESPFLVEIGAGAGAAAAIMSAALKVPVIAMDSHPKTLGLAEQFAERTGGTVESRVADIGDLASVLGGKAPAAVFGMTVYRYIQPHSHHNSSFSDWAFMQKLLATHRVDAQVTRFIEALRGADLVLSERTCPDYLAEIAAGLFPFGYDIPQGGITRIDGEIPGERTIAFGVHFMTADLPKRDPNLLKEMFMPLPRPYGDFKSDGPAAEALRYSLEPSELVDATEIVYSDGSERKRREIFAWGNGMAGQYVSTTRGARNLHVFQNRHLHDALEQVRADEARLVEAGQAEVRPFTLSALHWGGPTDNQPNATPWKVSGS